MHPFSTTMKIPEIFLFTIWRFLCLSTYIWLKNLNFIFVLIRFHCLYSLCQRNLHLYGLFFFNMLPSLLDTFRWIKKGYLLQQCKIEFRTAGKYYLYLNAQSNNSETSVIIVKRLHTTTAQIYTEFLFPFWCLFLSLSRFFNINT